MKKAFTMIELIFVIVILGILAAVAIPKFASTKRNADISAGRAEVATIRSAIVSERQTQLIKGINTYIPRLSTGNAGDNLFTGDGTRTLLMYGIKPGTGSGSWANTATTAGTTDTYTFTVDGVVTTFTYTVSTGMFTCTAGQNDCNALVD
ncbi:MAG: prepilin-type N-terminal cleavage/methylation domain-containing protein [Campylobacterota bacterium]|nr:prepilin-type N-terminal cleavage/methylation domain-containing protein [Campylobacterota bacterium]